MPIVYRLFYHPPPPPPPPPPPENPPPPEKPEPPELDGGEKLADDALTVDPSASESMIILNAVKFPAYQSGGAWYMPSNCLLQEFSTPSAIAKGSNFSYKSTVLDGAT